MINDAPKSEEETMGLAHPAGKREITPDGDGDHAEASRPADEALFPSAVSPNGASDFEPPAMPLRTSTNTTRGELPRLQDYEGGPHHLNHVLMAQAEASIDGILIVDGQGEIVFANRRFVDLWGFPEATMLTGSDVPLLQMALEKLADPEGFLAKVKQLYQHPEETSQDEVALKDGRVFDRYSAPIYGPDGEHAGRVWFFHDSTRRARAEAEILESRQSLDAIINRIADPVFVKDEERRFTLVNDAFCDIMDIPRDVLLRTGPIGFLSPKELDLLEQQDERVIATGVPDISESQVTRANGKLNTISSKKTLYTDSAGRKFVVCVIRDVTERKRADRLQQMVLQRTQVLLEVLRLPQTSEDALVALVLDRMVALTRSTLGFVGLVDPSETTMSAHLWSNRAMQECAGCAMCNDPIPFDIRTGGGWAEAISQRQIVIVNDHAPGDPLRMVCPAGRVQYTRLLGVPLIRDGRTVLVVGLGNKVEDYGEFDESTARLFLEVLWETLLLARSQEHLRWKTAELTERVKETACLYQMSDLLGTTSAPMNETLQAAVRLLPPAMLHAECACARIAIREQAATSDNFRATPWGLAANIEVSGEPVGAVQVYYLEEKPVLDEGPFMKEERGLIDHLAAKLGAAILRRRAEARIATLVAAVEQSSDDCILLDLEGRIQYVNPAFEQTTGYSAEEAVGQDVNGLLCRDLDEVLLPKIWESIRRGQPWKGRFSNRTKDGRVILLDSAVSAIRDPSGTVIGYVSARRDITKQLQMEAALIQANKLEAIGTLAGGIAHDLNNVLTGIVGYTELALMKCADDAPVQKDLEVVFQGAQRATDLVKQILTFSRHTLRVESPVQLGLIVREVSKFLRATVPATIEIRTDVQSTALVLADPTELHRTIVNLCTNAALAMNERGGLLEIGLADVDLDSSFAERFPAVTPGRCLRLRVRDTGHGMSREVLDRIFEPFFTTREMGKGTGMGLSVVHGIVTSLHGAITVESAPGEGAVFEIYLPVTQVAVPNAVAPSEEIRWGTERVLLVDDDPLVLGTVADMLRELGYQVRSEASGAAAQTAFKTDPQAFDLVITDMTMPGMAGDVLAEWLKSCRPDIPIILCSGYTEEQMPKGTTVQGIDEFLLKPLFLGPLSGAVRRVLDRPQPPHTPDRAAAGSRINVLRSTT
jgi:PAS domain S-box-containing protein